MRNIAVLSLQGNFAQHCQILERLSQDICIHQIKTTQDIQAHKFDGIILPGGESTSISYLMQKQNIYNTLKSLIAQGTPTLATCAGLILLAKHITHMQVHTSPESLALANITLERNSYGRQLDSFSADLAFHTHSKHSNFPINTVKGYFIRAPKITHMGEHVEVLASYKSTPIIVQEAHMLMSTFHPEACLETALHQYFVDEIILNPPAHY